MRTIILAAGVGSRLGKSKVPKCLLEVNNTTVIELLLKTLREAGIDKRRIRIVIGDQGEVWSRANQQRIQKICSDVVINPYNVNYENAYSLQLGFQDIYSDEVLLVDGDIFCEKKLLKEFLSHSRTDILLARPAVNPDEKGGKIYMSKERITAIGEELPREYYPWKIYSGIARLSPETCQRIRTNLSKVTKVVDAFNMVAGESEIGVFQPSFNGDALYYGWININTADDYKSVLERFVDNR
ncbi:NTP transferase domain-containing protein [Candidatus Omnitrophota bacterium]